MVNILNTSRSITTWEKIETWTDKLIQEYHVFKNHIFSMNPGNFILE